MGLLKDVSQLWLIVYKVPFPHEDAGWYCVTKGNVFLCAVLVFCGSDISLSENLISEMCFSTILDG